LINCAEESDELDLLMFDQHNETEAHVLYMKNVSDKQSYVVFYFDGSYKGKLDYGNSACDKSLNDLAQEGRVYY